MFDIPFRCFVPAVLIALLLAACQTTPPPAKPAAQATPAQKLNTDADQFAQRLENAPPPRQNVEVNWTTPAPNSGGDAANPNLKKADPSTPKTTAPEKPAEPATAPAPVATAKEPKAMTPAQMIEALDAQLRASASSGSDGLKPYISDAALTLLDPRRELTEKDMASLKPEDRQIVLAYQRAFTMLGRSLGKSPEEDRQNLQIAADELLEQLRSGHKTLKLLNANLCTRVNGYGVFTPFKSNTFLAGQEQRAIVYAELENFKPRIDSDGLYEVSLTQQLVLYNQADGLPVWRIAPTEIIDRSRNRRRDFFIIQVVALPARLGVGKYNLKLTVTDQIGQAVDEVQIPINIVADAKLIDE